LAGEAQCPDVWDQGHLNVLTVNLTLFEIARRDERLENFAEFAETKALKDGPVFATIFLDFCLLPQKKLSLRHLLAWVYPSWYIRYTEYHDGTDKNTRCARSFSSH
jgi:hypothetical protein